MFEAQGIPRNLSAGQVRWAPMEEDKYSLVFVGWDSEPRRFGIIYCFNRPSALYLLPVDRTLQLFLDFLEWKQVPIMEFCHVSLCLFDLSIAFYGVL